MADELLRPLSRRDVLFNLGSLALKTAFPSSSGTLGKPEQQRSSLQVQSVEGALGIGAVTTDQARPIIETMLAPDSVAFEQTLIRRIDTGEDVAFEIPILTRLFMQERGVEYFAATDMEGEVIAYDRVAYGPGYLGIIHSFTPAASGTLNEESTSFHFTPNVQKRPLLSVSIGYDNGALWRYNDGIMSVLEPGNTNTKLAAGMNAMLKQEGFTGVDSATTRSLLEAFCSAVKGKHEDAEDLSNQLGVNKILDRAREWLELVDKRQYEISSHVAQGWDEILDEPPDEIMAYMLGSVDSKQFLERVNKIIDWTESLTVDPEALVRLVLADQAQQAAVFIDETIDTITGDVDTAANVLGDPVPVLENFISGRLGPLRALAITAGNIWQVWSNMRSFAFGHIEQMPADILSGGMLDTPKLDEGNSAEIDEIIFQLSSKIDNS